MESVSVKKQLEIMRLKIFPNKDIANAVKKKWLILIHKYVDAY